MAGTKSIIRHLLVLTLAIGLANAAKAGVTPTPTGGATATPTATPSATPIPTATTTPTATPTATPIPTATATPSATPIPTATTTPTATPTATPIPTASATPSATPTATPTPTPTTTPTATPIPTASATPTASTTPPPDSVVDHFLCYKAVPARGASEKFKNLDKSEREVQLTNQFEPGGTDAVLTKTKQFCDPVNKNGEGILDPSAYLTCYGVKPIPSSSNPQVMSTDQFGEQALNVQKRRTQLCVPSQQVAQPTPTPALTAAAAAPVSNLDHFELYQVITTPSTPKFVQTEVDLIDEFWNTSVTLKKPVGLGVPTDQNGGGISHPAAHLTCYSMNAPRFPKTDVEVTNQFGQFQLTVRKPNMLCVPSSKEVVSDDD